MDNALPTVVIYGVGHFVAKKLILELLEKDMNVVGVTKDGLGEGVIGTIGRSFRELENFSLVESMAEIEGEVVNIFDFEGEEMVWGLAEERGIKLTVCWCNQRERTDEIVERLKQRQINWRLVESWGIYGPGMGREEMVGKAIVEAVRNENLTLPSVDKDFRLLAVDDLVEAIMRATYFLGTEKEDFLVLGKKTNSKEVAEVLIEEAKMTRKKIREEEMTIRQVDDGVVENNWNKIRWQPEIDFRTGVMETLQYFFSRVDEESRTATKRQSDKAIKLESEKEEKQERGERLWETEVIEWESEKGEELESERVRKKKRVKKKKKKKIKIKKKVEEKEEDFKIEPIMVKNSNLRPVSVARDEEREVEELVIEQKPEEVKVEEAEVREEGEVKVERKSWLTSKWWWVVLGVMIISMLAVPVSWAKDSWIIWRNFMKMERLVEAKSYEELSLAAEDSGMRARKVINRIDSWGLNKIGLVRNFQSVLRLVEDGSVLVEEGSGMLGKMDLVSRSVFGETEVDWQKTETELREGLGRVGMQMGLVEARLKGDWSWLPGRFKSWPNQGVKRLKEWRDLIALGEKGIGILPEILGADGKRRDYLVLLQNEMELRPGGGFIGSYAILSFESGRLLNFEVKDVYEADGQLKGHVEPPEEIKTYLGEGGWYLRDSNWDTDFGVVADKARWFLEKETGRTVDGVIGVNLATAKGFLAAAGEVYVPDFEEKINKDNLYEQAEFWAETKFFPGSKQKASFLGGLAVQLLEEIKTLPTDRKLVLFEEMINLLEENEIQIAVDEKETSRMLAELGWNGAMWQGGCGKEDCLADYLYIVEANLGVNKANYFIYRNIEQIVDISNSFVSRVVKINYENTAKNSNWPGGDYKNYMRIYIPDTASLAQVKLSDDRGQEKVFLMDELKILQVGDKKEIGFLVTIPVAEKRIVEVRYSTQVDLTDKSEFSYLAYIQKQSGYGETSLVNLVSFPEGWQPLQVEPAASLVKGKILFNQKLEKDIRMGVELSK